MALDIAIREQAEKATQLLLASQPGNPWLVGIDFEAKATASHPIELHLGLPILIFELKQSGVAISKTNAVQFVSDDIKLHQATALNGYLTIARAIINPRPTRKSQGWFARVFTSPPKWTPPQAKWKWTSVTQVVLRDDEVMVVKGFCCDC